MSILLSFEILLNMLCMWLQRSLTKELPKNWYLIWPMRPISPDRISDLIFIHTFLADESKVGIYKSIKIFVLLVSILWQRLHKYPNIFKFSHAINVILSSNDLYSTCYQQRVTSLSEVIQCVKLKIDSFKSH